MADRRPRAGAISRIGFLAVLAILPTCGGSGTVDPEEEEQNDSPTAEDATASGPKNMSVEVTIQGMDPEGSSLLFAVVQGPANGTLGTVMSGGATSATVLYTPDQGFAGDDEFTFTASDGEKTSSPATATVTIIDRPPTDPTGGDPILAEVTSGSGPVVIQLVADDPDGDPLTFQILTPPSNGVLGPIMAAVPASEGGPALVPSNATVEYTPNPGFFGTDSFTYSISDGTTETSPQEVQITVHPEPEPEPLNVFILPPIPGVVRDFGNQPLSDHGRFWSLYETDADGGVLFESRDPLEPGCYGTTIFNQSFQRLAEAYAAIGAGGCDHEPSIPPHLVNGPEIAAQGTNFIQFQFDVPFPDPPFFFSGQFSRTDQTGWIFDGDVDNAPGPITEISGLGGHLVGPLNFFEFESGTPGFDEVDLPAPDPGTGCAPDAGTLCLAGDRFRVQVDWDNGSMTGSGQAATGNDNSGLFWFFNPDHVDLVVKVLNTCSTNDRFWVFAAGLTNVEYEITVTDTQSGDFRTYTNPQAEPFEPIQDTSAFATCP